MGGGVRSKKRKNAGQSRRKTVCRLLLVKNKVIFEYLLINIADRGDRNTRLGGGGGHGIVLSWCSDLAQNPSKMLKCQGVYLEECPGFAQNPKFSIKMCFSPENTMA